jgi:hypothetical protein
VPHQASILDPHTLHSDHLLSRVEESSCLWCLGEKEIPNDGQGDGDNTLDEEYISPPSRGAIKKLKITPNSGQKKLTFRLTEEPTAKR